MSYPQVIQVGLDEANRNIDPSCHEEDGLTILGLTHSFRLSLPIDKRSVWNGSNFYGYRLRAFITGVGASLSAWISWYLCSLVIPQWMIWIWIEFRILGDNRSRIIRTSNYIKHFNGSSDWHFWNYVFWISWVIFLSGMISNHWKLAVDVAFAPHILSVVAAAVQYLESDEPMGWQRISLLAQCDAAFGYCLASWLMADGKRISSWLRSMSFWIIAFVFDNAAHQTDIITWSRVSYWYTLIDFDRSAAELVSVVLLVPAPVIAYVWLACMPSDKRAALYESSTIARWFTGSVYTFLNRLEVFDVFGAFAAQLLAAQYQHLYLRTEQTTLDQDIPPYRYHSLEPGHIRLLVLRKTTWQHGFVAELIHRPLTKDLRYEALSYHWGSSVLDRSILIDGKRMAITTSALKLLSARMSFFHERVIWLDALCINQNDLEEKALQVPLMSQIYKQANRVILVPSHEFDDRIAASLLYEIGTPNNGIGPGSLEGRLLHIATFLRKDHSTVRWEALVRLLQQPYFKRAWIVQEIAVGEDVLLLLGGVYVPWRIFHEAIVRLDNAHFGSLLMPLLIKIKVPGRVSLSQIRAINALRPDSINGTRGNILPPTQLNQPAMLLALLTWFQATDQRDKVYAIAGMVAGIEANTFLAIDYSKTIADVNHEAGRAVLFGKHPVVDMLAYAGTGWRGHSDMPMSSWCPNFVMPQDWRCFTDVIQDMKRFQASGTTTAAIKQGPSTRHLQVEGFICDTILDLVEVFGMPDDFGNLVNTGQISMRDMLARFQAGIGDAIHLVQQYRPEISLAELQSAFMAHQVSTADIPSDALIVLWHWLHDALIMLGPEADDQNTVDMSKLRSSLETLYTYGRYVSKTFKSRRFGITTAGRMCIVPPLAEPGDTICIFHGAQTPYVIDNRLLADPLDDEWVLIGECYVEGIMQGELVRDDIDPTILTLI